MLPTSIFHSLFKLIQRLFGNAYVFVGVTFIATLLIFSSEFLSAKLPGSLWDLSEDSESDVGDLQEDIAKNIVNEVVVKKGDALISILAKQKIPMSERPQIVALAKKEKLTSKLQIGQKISFYYNIELVEQLESELVEEKMVLERMSVKIDQLKSLEFVREGDKFVKKVIETPIKKIVTRYDASIERNIISSLREVGLGNNISIQLVNAYSYQLDLQRQIRKGDRIKVIVEKYVTDEGKLSHYGRILHASLSAKGKNYDIYSYAADGKNHRFYNGNGQSIRSTLLRTPVDVVRISSHFGWRKKHPVLGYGKMHKGVDFAASTGTPIYAAGDGVVEFVGWKNGYGRFVLIKHNRTLSTAYAHASKFAKNLKKGSKVKQGQIIAYVGMTGHATGPHLHYEVRVNGKQVNPLKFKSSPGVKLTGKQLSKFNKFKQEMQTMDAKLTADNDLDITEEVAG